MSTWALVIMFWSGANVFMGGSGTTVPGFTSKASCEAAAVDAKKQISSSSTFWKAICVEVK